MPLVRPNIRREKEVPALDPAQIVLSNATARTGRAFQRIGNAFSALGRVRVPQSTRQLLKDVWFGVPVKKNTKPLKPYSWSWNNYPRRRWIGFDRTRKKK